MTFQKRVFLAVLLGLTVSGCALVDYAHTTAGRLQGTVLVMWVSEGDSSGDGNFLFVPDPDDPLIFYRPNANSHGAVIQPGMMYTDGGSIPKIFQVFNGLSPWGYAPAYMIHDWLFVSRHCIVDGTPLERAEQVRDVEFDDSAAILGEAIHTLVETKKVKRNDFAGETITGAVDSVVARNLWDETGACAKSVVEAGLRAAIEGKIRVSKKMPLDKSVELHAFRWRHRAAPAQPTTAVTIKIIDRVTVGR